MSTRPTEAELFSFLRDGGPPLDLVIQHGLESAEALELYARFTRLQGACLLQRSDLDAIRSALSFAPDEPLDPSDIAEHIRMLEHTLLSAFERHLGEFACEIAKSALRDAVQAHGGAE